MHDPFGIGLAAAIILAVATLLELAVLGIKISASRNSEYELSVARDARRALKAETELDSAADAIAGEAMAEVRVDPVCEMPFSTADAGSSNTCCAPRRTVAEPSMLEGPSPNETS